MPNFKLVIGMIMILVLYLAGCSESENINSPLSDSNNSVQSFSKFSDTFARNTLPSEGIVVEGVSVPGIELGFSRAQVEAAYGEPQWCQSNGSPGNKAYCSFPVINGGQVNVHYRGAYGDLATGSDDDVVFKIEWTEATSEWTTKAGVSTKLAKQNPEAVISAYPDARVIYNQFGGIYRVVDYPLGIEVLWIPDFYTGQTHVQMAIFYPMEEPPPPENFTHVASINLTTQKVRGKHQVQAFVKVQDENDQSVRGATVVVHWTFPDGSTEVVENATSSSGNAHFSLINVSRGTYSLTVEDVVIEGYVFDIDNSVLSASINVR